MWTGLSRSIHTSSNSLRKNNKRIMTQTPNIAIVGAGIMGLAAAWALAKRGVRVSVFEQYAIPNPLGSSVDQHRLIRYPYGSEAGYTRMNDAAFAAWDR